MPSSSDHRIGIALQTAKSVPAAAPQLVFDATASGLTINREASAREEMGQGRDQTDPVTNLMAASGDFTFLARPSVLALVYFGVLGAKATTGSAVPYTHTLTAAADGPYFTIWDDRYPSSDVGICIRFEDVKLTSANLTGPPGGDLSMQSGIVGGKSEREADGLPSGGTYVAELPLRTPGRSIKKDDGASSDAISDFAVNITSNVNVQQTSQLYHSYHEPGGREVGGTYTEVYESPDLYNSIYFGDPEGTELTGEQLVGKLDYKFFDEKGVEGLSLAFPRVVFSTDAPSIATGEEIPSMSVAWTATKPQDNNGNYTGAPICTATVKNKIAAYPAA